MGYFLYVRKSEEDDGRQVQSIGDQLSIGLELARSSDLAVVAVFEEARSAKRTGRPIFNEMIARIEAGEADGIIAWHPDRLSRNAVDAGVLIDLLDRGRLCDLKFQSYKFENTPEGKWMLNIVLGQGKYFVDKLSKDVKRGMQSKLDKGHAPQVAPVGYRNDRENKIIVADPERFEMVQNAMRLVLTGAYSAPEALRVLNHDWGFRTQKRARSGGTPLPRSVFYNMLSNVFYTGQISYDGETYRGKHPAMLTQEEFERLQQILGKKTIVRQKREFDFTGLMRCGLCDCSITAETKKKHYKNTGRTVTYTYYHCTNGRGGCSKRGVTHEGIEAQVKDLLQAVSLHPRVAQWCLDPARDYFNQAAGFEHDAIESLQKALALVQRKKSNLIHNQLSDPDMFSAQEFKAEKESLQFEINQLHHDIKKAEEKLEDVRHTVENVFNFAINAAYSFEHGDTKLRKEIAARLGIKYCLTLGKLEIVPHLLLTPILAFEPQKVSSQSDEDGEYEVDSLAWCALLDEIRTLAMRLEYGFPRLVWKTNINASAYARIH